jgi:hypothetical protein
MAPSASVNVFSERNTSPQFTSVSYLTPLLSVTHPEKPTTSLFSSTHWEHFFWPFVFNQPLGSTFIFNISCDRELDLLLGPADAESAGVLHPHWVSSLGNVPASLFSITS